MTIDTAFMALLLLTAEPADGASSRDAGATPSEAVGGDAAASASSVPAVEPAGTPSPALPAPPPPPPAPTPVPPPPTPAPLPAAAGTPDLPARLDPLVVIGTRESRTAGSAHVLKSKDLERLDLDNAETVVKAVPGVYGRGEDGVGLRPNIGIRGTTPDRSKKLTLMEDGVLFGPAPYSAPAAYYFPIITRMQSVRVIKGPGAISFGPHTVGGAIDLVTRSIPDDATGGEIDLAGGAYGYRKLHAVFGAGTPHTGYIIEGVHLGSNGFKQIDGAPDADTGFTRNEWMWKGRYRLSSNPAALQDVGLKLGYSDEDSRETYLGLTDADLRQAPHRRYRASLLDRMQWRRTQVVATYRAQLRDAFTIDVAVYRHDFDRTWRKVNRIGGRGGSDPTTISNILADPTSGQHALLYSVLTGQTNAIGGGAGDTIFIGPNHRTFVSQGIQGTFAWRGSSGPVAHRAELGVRFHYDRIERLHTEDGFLMRDAQLTPDGLATLTVVDGRAWTRAGALHVGDAVTWGPVTVTPGARVELISSWLRDRKAGTETAAGLKSILLPGVGLFGALSPSLGLLAGVYRGFSPVAPGQPASVQPELSVNYEIGARWRRRALRVEAIGFLNDYSNLTSVCTFASGCASGQVDAQYDAGRALIYGAELFAQGDIPLPRGWAVPLTAAYTVTRTRLEERFNSDDPTLGNVEVGDELPYVPRHQAVGTVAVEGPPGALVIGGSYVSAMRERAGQGPIPTEWRTDPSFILDLTARVGVAVNGHVYVHVRNALGADDIASHRPFGARPVAPRWIQAGVKWQF